MKQISKNKLTENGLVLARSEVAIHSGLDHPHIVKLLAASENDDLIELKMEMCSDGAYFEREVLNVSAACNLFWCRDPAL